MSKQATGFNQPEIDIDVLMGRKPIPTSSTQPQAPVTQNDSGSAIDMDVLMGRKPIPTAGEQPEPSESSEVGEIPNNPDAAFDVLLGPKIDLSPEAIRERSEFSASPFAKGIRDAVGSVQAQGGYNPVLGKDAVAQAAQKKVYQPLNKNLADAVQGIIDHPDLRGYELNADNLDTYLKTEEERASFEEVLRDRYGDTEVLVSDLSTISRPMESGEEILRSVVFTHNGENIEIPIGLAEDWVAQHNAEVLHNMRFKEEPEYRNEWFLRNVGVTEQAYRDEVAADLENRLHELRKKVVATLPVQHTRGGYAAIGAAANKPSSGAPVSLEKIDKALKVVNTLRKNNFGAGLKEGFDPADILTLGVSGIGENVALLNALNKSASGKTLTTSEQALVEAWDIQNEAEEVIDTLGGRKRGAKVGYGVSQALGFMTQTAGTGGIASLATKGIGRAAARTALLRATNMGVNKSIKEGLRYGGLKVAESAVGAAARTPFMGFTYQNYTDKRLNQFQVKERVDEATGEISKYIDKQEASALRDAAHAVLESYFESQSEDVGGLIDFGITSFARALPLKGLLRNRAAEALRGPVKNGAMKLIKESVKLHSIIGETLSEAYGDAMVNLLTANNEGWKQMATSEYWWELGQVSSILSGGFWVANQGVNALAYKDERKAINKNLEQRKKALSRIEDDNLKKELTEATLTDDLIDRSKRLSGLDWSNFSREDMANAVDFIDAQTRLDVMREGATESRRLARIMPAIDEVKKLADGGALDDEQAAASLATIYSDLFRTQENQRTLNILTDRIKVAADAGISADKINDILRGAGLTVFNPGDEIETLTGDRAIVDKVLPGAYEIVNDEGVRAVVSFEEVLQNAPEIRQIQQESQQPVTQSESTPEINPQVEQAVEVARQEAADIINKDDSTVYEVETDDGITGYIIGGKGIVVDNDGGINQSAEDTVVVKTDEGNKVVHKERVKVKSRQTLQEIEDLARGAAEGALAAVQPQQPVGGKIYQGIYDNEQVTINLPREIKFNEDGSVDYDSLLNPETVSVIRPGGIVVDEVNLSEIDELTEVKPEAEQVPADTPVVEQQEEVQHVSETKMPYELSDEVDENGRQFVKSSTGAIEFGQVDAESGLAYAPILLSEGMITNKATNDGYGLVHIEARHGDQIRKAGYNTVVEFVEDVAKNYEVIKEGNVRDGHNTYLLQLKDKHNNTLMVELSGDGTYWNINTAGVFKTSYGKNRKEVYNRHTTAKQPAETIEASRNPEPSGTQGSPSMVTASTLVSSDNKDTTSEPKNQEVAQKNVAETTSVVQQPQIPTLKNGEPDYNAMDAQMFVEQYVSRFGEERTEKLARNNIKVADKAIDTLEKQIDGATDPNKIPALYEKQQTAKVTRDKYATVLDILGLSVDENEDNAARVQRKKQENTSWFNKLFPDGFPNVEGVILWDIANGNRIRWTNKEVNGAVVSKGLGSHLGLADSNAERTRRVALIGKDAPTPEEYAEQLPERLNAMGIRFEESELLDKVIAVYTSVDTVRKAKEELETMSANMNAEQEDLDYEEEQMRRNYEREQEVLRKEAQADVVDEQTEQEQPTNEETQEEELSIEDEVPFMVSSDSVQTTNEAQQLATEAVITALEDAGVEVVNATPEMVEEALQRKDVQLQAVNQKFNEQLDSFTEENATSVVFDLGMPSPILLAGGVADKPIKLYGNKLLKKIRKHGLNLEELKGLPIAIANPIAIFDNYRKSGNRSVLTELKTKDGNILVSIEIGKGVDIDFDMVKSVFGKDDNGVLNWINKGYLTFVDKEKALGYLYPSAPIAATANSQELDSATKIVENFENPKIVPDNSVAVEDPSLIGLHNISEEKLRKAFRVGALVNPSVAVIDANSQRHTGYGDITFVLPSSMIAKKTGKNIGTYFGDAWTPTYPQIVRKLGNNVASQDIMSVPEEMRSQVRMSVDNWLDGRSAQSLAYLFLYQRGEAPEMYRVQPQYSEALHNAMSEITKGKAFYYLTPEQRSQVLELYIQENHGSREAFDVHIQRALDRSQKFLAERGANSLVGRKAQEVIDTIGEYGYDYDAVSGFVSDVLRDMEQSGVVDSAYTMLQAEQKVKSEGFEREFERWLDSLEDRYEIKEVIFKGFTPSGNRRYVPHTAENASKEMRSQGRAGATGLSIGFSNFAARLLQPGVTLDDIRKRKRQLKTSIEEVDAFKDKWSSVMFDLGEKCQPNATGYEDYGLERLAEAATKNDPQAYLKSEYGVDLSDEDVKRLKDMVKAVRTEYPVMYFETKFERPVYFNEFAGAVVPDNTSADVVQSLKDAGIPVWTYAASDENARMDAIKNIANSSNDIFFSIGPAPVFVSNAKIAVLGIKQEKATPEQWLKMIEKAGGLKAGEDKWIGLSDWLKTSDKKTLTKREVLDYINENQIQIEETTYSSNSAVETTPEFKALQEEFKQIAKGYEDEARRNLDEYEAKLAKKYNLPENYFDTTVLNSDESKAHSSLSRITAEEIYNAAWADLVDKYGDDFELAFWRGYDGIRVDNAEAAGILLGLPIDRPIYHLREDYTTKGLEGNREIALTVPTIESWNENDEVHFGDAGEGRAIAWVRFGETTDEDGNRVLVIDEIQSKRHQEGREKGYRPSDVDKYLKDNNVEVVETGEFYEFYRDGELDRRFSKGLLHYKVDEAKKLYVAGYNKSNIPEAPFEKNWAELAMKRMLRYAAENGYDVIAWTKGEQQAERYNIGSVVDKIVSYTEDGAKTVRIYLKNNEPLNLKVDSEGKILYSNRLTVSAGQNLSDVVGKDVAVKILRGDGEDATIYAGKGKEYAAKQLSGNGLRIGGEGMRAFYDQMLPSFMRKYGKKWGATVQDVTLPFVEEAGRTMHSVDVTESMRESVMQGQPMFYRRPNGTVYGWTNGTTVYLTESGMNPNSPIHEYTHIWSDAMRKHNPEGWESIVKLLKGTPVWNEVMADTNYANIHGDENKVASEALSRISGRENSAKMEAMAQLMIDENANDTVKKNRARKLLDRMRKALQEFWSWVGKELFGIKNFERIEQVTDRILYDLVSGTDLNPELSFDTPAAEHAEEVASNAQKIADKFGLSNEIVVAETQEIFVNELQSENVADEFINSDAIAVFTPSGRIMVNAQMIPDIVELPDSIMHEFAHNVTHNGDMPYRIQDTVLEVGEERFEAFGRELFGTNQDPWVVADEIIATFVGNAANPTLYEGVDLISGVVSGQYTTDEAVAVLMESLTSDIRDGYVDVIEGMMPYVKEVLDAIKTNHDEQGTRAGAPKEKRRVRISVQGYAGEQKKGDNRSNDESYIRHEGYQVNQATSATQAAEEGRLERVNEFSIGPAPVASESQEQSASDQENKLTPQEDKAKDKTLKQLDRLNKVINSLRQTVKQAERDNVDLANIVQAALEEEVKDGGINRFLDVPELISLIRSGMDKKSIESTMDRLSERLTDAIIKNREEQLAKLLQVQVQGTNAFGIPIGYAVDDETRAMVEFFRENLSRDMKKIVETMENADEKFLQPYNKSELNVWFTAYKEIEESRYNIKATQKDIDHETERSQSFYRLAKELKAKNASESQIKTAQEHRRQALRNKKAQKKAILVAKQTLAQELEGMIFLLGGRLRDGRAIRAGRLSADKVYAKNFLTEAMADVRVNDGTKTYQGTKEQLEAKAKFHKDIRFRTSAYRSYAYMIQSISRNAIGGKGFLWDALMEGKNGWVDCNDKRLAMDNIDNQEILAHVQASGLKSVADLQRLFDQQLVDKNGNPYVFRYETDRTGRIDQDIRPTIGWATYIVLCFEQDDMAPTMEKMRITEEQVQQIRDMLPEAAKKFLKWSREMLSDRRQRIYNPASLERFGTQMANIPNYFPIRRLEKNLHRVEEVEQVASADSDQVTIMANALIKRVRNVVEIDFQQNPLELLKKHLERMNGFAANVPLARNVNILLNSSGFRDQLNEQGDPNTYEYFKAAAKVALSSYKPKPAALDSVMIELQGWLAAGKIAWRFFTALKQLLSIPAFWTYNISPRYKAIFIRSVLWPAVKNGDEGKLVAIWKWGMDNIPQLKERWSSRYAGNEKLAQVKETLTAQFIAKHAVLRNSVGKIGEWGMIPNAAVDLFACSIGCYAVYKFELEQLQKKGYSKEEADELAKRRASIAFNESQQSSEAAFIAPLQRDRTFLAVQVSLFNNSNFGYGRKEKLARKYLWQQTFNKDLREKRLALAKRRYLERFLNEERNRLVENNNKIADVAQRLRPEEIDRMVESKRAEFSKRAEKEANRDAKMSYAKGVEDVVMFKWLLNMAWAMAPTAVTYWLSCAIRQGDDEDPENPLSAETLALMFATATFRNAIGGGLLESGLNGYGFTGLVGSEVEKTVDILAQALQPLWLTDEEAESFDPLAVWMAVKQCLVMGTGFDVNVYANILTGLVGLFNDRSRTTADVLRILNAPKSMIREIEIIPFEDETLDNYTRRMAMMENVALDRMEELKEKPSSELNASDLKVLRKKKKWEKNLITIRQAEAADVPYGREVDGRVVAPGLKQLDADYTDLLKSLDLTQSGKNRAGKVEFTEDERRRKKALRVVTRVKGIHNMEESASEVINNPEAYKKEYRQIVEEKRKLIEDWNK